MTIAQPHQQATRASSTWTFVAVGLVLMSISVAAAVVASIRSNSYPFGATRVQVVAASLFVGTTGTAVIFLALNLPGIRRVQRHMREVPTLTNRLSGVADSIIDVMRELNSLEQELVAQSARAEALREESTNSTRLAALDAQERAAVAHLVRAEIALENRRAARSSLKSNLVFFIVGVVCSVVITLVVKPMV